MTRAHTAAEDYAGRPVKVAAQSVDELPLFAPTIHADAARGSFVARQVERLIPVAVELAQKAGRSGVTVGDLRITAVNRGILTGAEGAPHPGTGKLMKPRELSYLGSVMKAAGLVPTDDYRRSDVPGSNGNLHKVWLAPGPTGGSDAARR
jgi:hypothetical protein